MADAPLRLFISYSRTDSDFVDTLQADLQARNFDAWVDRTGMEGGRDFAQSIQRAIDRCQVVLVVLSPAALASEWVTTEYSYAQDNDKRIIPLLYRNIPKLPMRLNRLHYEDFQSNYAKGLSDLLVALTPIAALPLPPPIEVPAPAPDPSDLVEVRPPPPLPNATLLALYRAGLEASVDGDLERADILWGQVLKQDEDFEHGLLKQQLAALNANLRPIRIQRSRESARAAAQNEDWRQVAGAWRALLELEPGDPQAAAGLRDALRQRAAKARREGQWGEEIGAYEALLKLEPDDEEARERMPNAEQNLQWEYKYKSAQDFVQAEKPAAARAELELLWSQAPFYGDPAGIAPLVGATLPPPFEVVKAARLKEDAEARTISEWNGRWKVTYEHIASQAWRYPLSARDSLQTLWEYAPYFGDPSGIAPRLGLTVPPSYAELKRTAPDVYEQSAREALAREQRSGEDIRRVVNAKAWGAVEPRLVVKAKGERAYFVKLNLQANVWHVTFSTLCLLFGVGCYVGIFTATYAHVGQVAIPGCAACSILLPNLAPIYGVGGMLIAGILLYWLALRRVHGITGFRVILLVSGALVYFVSAGLPSRPASPGVLGVQLIVGIIIGCLAGLISTGLLKNRSGDWVWFGILFPGFFAVLLWCIIAATGNVFLWPVRFGYGWQYGLLGGVILALMTWAGIDALLIILIPGLQKHYSEDKVPAQRLVGKPGSASSK